jgi:hypothetical protein
MSVTSAFAQAADPNPGAVSLTMTFDTLNTYMFRGIRQNGTEVAMWPTADLGMALFSGEGGLKSASLNLGTWNSLHTGDTGFDSEESGLGCACSKLWYESDFYATLGLGFGGGVGLATTYTAYTSPNNGFSTVKEVMFKLSADDTAYLGKAAVKPYAVFAFEVDTEKGRGQADGGAGAGKYVELGIAPGYAGSKASLTVPVKVGLSAGDYYEHPLSGVDHKFGYFSLAGIVTVPLGGTTKFGSFNLHGGAEFQALGECTKFFAGKDKIGIYSVGFGWSY